MPATPSDQRRALARALAARARRLSPADAAKLLARACRDDERLLELTAALLARAAGLDLETPAAGPGFNLHNLELTPAAHAAYSGIAPPRSPPLGIPSPGRAPANPKPPRQGRLDPTPTLLAVPRPTLSRPKRQAGRGR